MRAPSSSMRMGQGYTPFAVTVRQLLAVDIEAGVVKYEATFHYDIRYSAVKFLRIDVPAELVSEIHNRTPDMRDHTIDPPPADRARSAPARGSC